MCGVGKGRGGGGGGGGGYVIANIPIHGNGLGCALVTSRGTKAVSGEALLAPFVLTDNPSHAYQFSAAFEL